MKIGDFSYTIRDNYWHEYKYQVGSKWRRFVVQFDDQDQKKFEQYEEKLKEILLEVNDNAEVKRNKCRYIVGGGYWYLFIVCSNLVNVDKDFVKLHENI